MERQLKRWSIAVVISFVTAAPAFARAPTEVELRAVISTWRNVRQVIENGAPVGRHAPVYYRSRFTLNRLTKDQEREIQEWARQADLWRDVWFVEVESIRSGGYTASIYFKPDVVQGRFRQGKVMGRCLVG